LQSLSSKKSHNEGREILGLDICNDDSQGQAWSFSIPVPENEISYTVHNGFLNSCLVVNEDGSYGFETCDDSSQVFLVEEDAFASQQDFKQT
jgi:predicted glycosyltransferase involved in capsule biosynthesis